MYLPPEAPLSGAQINHFRAVGEANHRAPSTRAVGDALYWALDDLRVFRGSPGGRHREAIAAALGDLGLPPGPRPPRRRLLPGFEGVLRPGGLTLQVVASEDEGHSADFLEMWVFAREPAELTVPGYRLEVERAHLRDPAKTLAYFVPPGDACNDLCAVLGHLYRGGDPLRRAGLFVVECAAVRLLPHMVIYNPGRPDERGEVRVVDPGGELRFCPLEPAQTGRIVSTIHAAGVGLDQRCFAPAEPAGPAETPDPRFRLAWASPPRR